MAFGDENNYRLEPLTFEVVPFKSAYHAIFGRPAFTAFHARSCYIYGKLKMAGPNGIITVNCDFDKAEACEQGEAAFTESVLGAQELQQAQKDLDPAEMPTTKKEISKPAAAFKPDEETKNSSTCRRRSLQGGNHWRRFGSEIGKRAHRVPP